MGTKDVALRCAYCLEMLYTLPGTNRWYFHKNTTRMLKEPNCSSYAMTNRPQQKVSSSGWVIRAP